MPIISDVRVERPSDQELSVLGVRDWPIWQKESSTFDWHYDQKEVCYLLEGSVEVYTADGSVTFGAGDLVTFPKDLACTWTIRQDVKKHYRFE